MDIQLDLDAERKMDLDNNRWTFCKNRLRELLPSGCGLHWLEALLLVKITSSKVVFAGIPHELYRLDIKNHYEDELRAVLEEGFPEHGPFQRKRFEYRLGQSSPRQPPVQEEFFFDKEAETSPPLPAHSAPPKVSSPPARLPVKLPTSGFSQLVVGNHNRLACRAIEQILEEPGQRFNPFLIYGPEGTGKSYLFQAFSEEWKNRHSDTRLISINAEGFLNEFIRDVRSHQMARFRERYRSADLLILEDLQVLSSSPQCQQELKHTLATLRQENKQVLLSANALPSKIAGLQSSLSVKLEAGLALDLMPPDRQTCLRILLHRAERSNIPLPETVAQYLAHTLPPNISQLEAALIRLGAHASLLGETITLDLVRKLIPEQGMPSLESTSSQSISSSGTLDQEEWIMERVCQVLRLDSTELRSGRRDKRVVKARQFITYLLTEECGQSLNQIGQILGRSHSTIHNALRNAQNNVESDELFRKQIQFIQRELQSRSEPSPLSLTAVAPLQAELSFQAPAHLSRSLQN